MTAKESYHRQAVRHCEEAMAATRNDQPDLFSMLEVSA